MRSKCYKKNNPKEQNFFFIVVVAILPSRPLTHESATLFASITRAVASKLSKA